MMLRSVSCEVVVSCDAAEWLVVYGSSCDGRRNFYVVGRRNFYVVCLGHLYGRRREAPTLLCLNTTAILAPAVAAVLLPGCHENNIIRSGSSAHEARLYRNYDSILLA